MGSGRKRKRSTPRRPAPDSNAPSSSDRPIRLGAILAAGVTLALQFGLAGGPPLAWDEGNAVVRAYEVSRWSAGVLTGEFHPLDAETIAAQWAFTVRVEGHPAMYATTLVAMSITTGGY